MAKILSNSCLYPTQLRIDTSESVPQVVVCGEQISGKKTLVERLIAYPVPRTSVLYILFRLRNDQSLLEEAASVCLEGVTGALQATERSLESPSMAAAVYDEILEVAKGERVDGIELRIVVTLKGANRPDLDLLILPALTKSYDKPNQVLVRQTLTRLISMAHDSRNIFLLVLVPVNTRLNTAAVMHFFAPLKMPMSGLVIFTKFKQCLFLHDEKKMKIFLSLAEKPSLNRFSSPRFICTNVEASVSAGLVWTVPADRLDESEREVFAPSTTFMIDLLQQQRASCSVLVHHIAVFCNNYLKRVHVPLLIFRLLAVRDMREVEPSTGEEEIEEHELCKALEYLTDSSTDTIQGSLTPSIYILNDLFQRCVDTLRSHDMDSGSLLAHIGTAWALALPSCDIAAFPASYECAGNVTREVVAHAGEKCVFVLHVRRRCRREWVRPRRCPGGVSQYGDLVNATDLPWCCMADIDGMPVECLPEQTGVDEGYGCAFSFFVPSVSQDGPGAVRPTHESVVIINVSLYGITTGKQFIIPVRPKPVVPVPLMVSEDLVEDDSCEKGDGPLPGNHVVDNREEHIDELREKISDKGIDDTKVVLREKEVMKAAATTVNTTGAGVCSARKEPDAVNKEKLLCEFPSLLQYPLDGLDAERVSEWIHEDLLRVDSQQHCRPPTIILAGERGCGKRSLLARIIDFPVPRTDGRVTVEFRLRRLPFGCPTTHTSKHFAATVRLEDSEGVLRGEEGLIESRESATMVYEILMRTNDYKSSEQWNLRMVVTLTKLNYPNMNILLLPHLETRKGSEMLIQYVNKHREISLCLLVVNASRSQQSSSTMKNICCFSNMSAVLVVFTYCNKYVGPKPFVAEISYDGLPWKSYFDVADRSVFVCSDCDSEVAVMEADAWAIENKFFLDSQDCFNRDNAGCARLLLQLEKFYCQVTISCVYPDVVGRLLLERDYLIANGRHCSHQCEAAIERTLRAALFGLVRHLYCIDSSTGLESKARVDEIIQSCLQRIDVLYDNTSILTRIGLWPQVAHPHRMCGWSYSATRGMLVESDIQQAQWGKVNEFTLLIPARMGRAVWPGELNRMFCVTAALTARREFQLINLSDIDGVATVSEESVHSRHQEVSDIEITLYSKEFVKNVAGHWDWYFHYRYTLPLLSEVDGCNDIDSICVRVNIVFMENVHVAGSPFFVRVDPNTK